MRPSIVVISAVVLLTLASTNCPAFWPLPPETTGNLYVSSWANDMVLVFSEAGTELDVISAAGLDGPRGVAFNADKEVYVASQNSYEIFVFDAAGAFQRSFTGGGLNGPNCVAFDSQEYIYVASALDASVKKFDSSGQFVDSFTGGGLASPMSIARTTSDVLYVSSGGSNRVVKFDTDGNEVGVIQHGDFSTPQGIAFDENGHWFCSQASNDMIVEFDESDAHVQTFSSPNLDFPRSMAFLPNPSGLGVGESGAPLPLTVLRSFPEPFSTKVCLELQLSQSSYVELTLLDPAGRRIDRLLGGRLPAGRQTVAWDGRDAAGRYLSSGVYFYRLVIEGRATYGRLTVAR